MKGLTVLLILITAVVVSVTLFYDKVKGEQDELDVLRSALGPVHHIIAPGSHIDIVTAHKDLALLSKARYILAPSFLQFDTAYGSHDTLLAIQHIRAADSILNKYLSSRNIIWQYRDSLYHYTLTAK